IEMARARVALDHADGRPGVVRDVHDAALDQLGLEELPAEARTRNRLRFEGPEADAEPARQPQLDRIPRNQQALADLLALRLVRVRKLCLDVYVLVRDLGREDGPDVRVVLVTQGQWQFELESSRDNDVARPIRRNVREPATDVSL